MSSRRKRREVNVPKGALGIEDRRGSAIRAPVSDTLVVDYHGDPDRCEEVIAVLMAEYGRYLWGIRERRGSTIFAEASRCAPTVWATGREPRRAAAVSLARVPLAPRTGEQIDQRLTLGRKVASRACHPQRSCPSCERSRSTLVVEAQLTSEASQRRTDGRSITWRTSTNRKPSLLLRC
jgi:hypothetical protein